ncbi:hypothetical protein A2852_02490 [Candidatus Adlerbacteria bacterium RIFCSPHIGHO2_01_FULL_54_23]|uniref:Uncharacterized protein n=3 Tax=Candidatus Adleribacteriota TaxID=1752736 RepID=A0A1F4Y0Y2_9BACT|nr:MAG: hypothetical protein UY83_C0002G0028 [Candidatus Adlerbacteria bacterium GW2011_GWA1_54_10]KKW37987.1 MAG: hypothetical protein UY86_C0002G0084 [Candidatus Adlerbacteria bacterium GW2011_GWB1_54_7]OGC78594.1 MAG: hypothetical protein A2852_02490 [Candidatus Adlerbacteria bacterium RIFCSPHIGHO2_01_FULL_54_23]OGC87602.1 MAG: hypothetical protein A3B33_01685 [Candidatus Adlerbacteria bacterium RIFCSPLOWO2_01_FULL_54_16]
MRRRSSGEITHFCIIDMPENNQQGGLSWTVPVSVPAVKEKISNAAPALVHAKPAQKLGNAAKYAGFFAVGVIAGILLAWGWSAWRVSISSTFAETGSSQNTGSALEEESAGLVVATPQRAGISVQISEVSVSAPTWIVVYENNGGEPGNALGATLFFPSSKQGAITLLRGTVAGQTYLVGKRADDGDRRFSLTKDAPLTEDGVSKFAQFMAN